MYNISADDEWECGSGWANTFTETLYIIPASAWNHEIMAWVTLLFPMHVIMRLLNDLRTCLAHYTTPHREGWTEKTHVCSSHCRSWGTYCGVGKMSQGGRQTPFSTMPRSSCLTSTLPPDFSIILLSTTHSIKSTYPPFTISSHLSATDLHQTTPAVWYQIYHPPSAAASSTSGRQRSPQQASPTCPSPSAVPYG